MEENYLVKLNRINQVNLSTMVLHTRTFSKFKGIHQGDDIVLVASGVTADQVRASFEPSRLMYSASKLIEPSIAT